MGEHPSVGVTAHELRILSKNKISVNCCCQIYDRKGSQPGKFHTRSVEGNIDFQIGEAMRLSGSTLPRRLMVVGGIIDTTNSYGRGKDRLVIINLNGKNDPQKMRLMREVATLGQEYAPMLGSPEPPPADQADKPADEKSPVEENKKAPGKRGPSIIKGDQAEAR